MQQKAYGGGGQSFAQNRNVFAKATGRCLDPPRSVGPGLLGLPGRFELGPRSPSGTREGYASIAA